MQYAGEVVISDAAKDMLGALLALGGLQLVMMLWLYGTRIPALIAGGIKAQEATPEMLRKLPKEARNVAANYNNLFEAPTLYFAVVLAIVVLGGADGFYGVMAWSYVALRLVHSIIQATVNIILWRSAVFGLSWLVLGVMLVRCALSFL